MNRRTFLQWLGIGSAAVTLPVPAAEIPAKMPVACGLRYLPALSGWVFQDEGRMMFMRDELNINPLEMDAYRRLQAEWPRYYTLTDEELENSLDT